ncbi:hypothetical protein J3R83DRAFT_9654 [Lanmaoa asiatica]|nr:hypothetical protein J3R83DRAFT_9654 [Lanmaoa asiatica]
MPFLSRRSVDPQAPTSLPRDRSYFKRQSEGAQTPRIRARSEASLFRRVSTLFAVRRRTSSKASSPHTNISPAGIGYSRPYPQTMLPRVSSDSTPQPSLEIRRPSGLGRRASLLESNDSITDSESFDKEGEDMAPVAHFIRQKDRIRISGFRPRVTRRPSLSPTPFSALSLNSFHETISLSLRIVSRGLCSAARYALYHSLDAQTIAESPLEKLYNVLACKKELAALVVFFHCHSWPSWQPASSDGRVSSDDVRQALQNMHNLKSLTLPSFASMLSHTPSFTFSLTHLTILDKKITQSQLVALRSWLVTQSSLESLSFPHLVEYPSTDPSFVDEWAPIADPSRTNGYNPFTTLLPGLKSLHASTEIVSMLCFAINNPIQHLTLDVHETLFTGLRPSSVIRSLNGVREMHVIFAPEVDKRTVEKFLGVTGSMLTGEDKGEAMKSLEVEVSWTDNDAAETLYGIVTSIISRFRGLETLKLTLPFRSIQAPIPSPVSFSLLCPPSPAPSPPRTASSFDPPSICAATLCDSMVRKEFVACGIEKGYAKTWTKHCPSLSDIQFDFSCSTTDADVELCGVWFRRKIPSLPLATLIHDPPQSRSRSVELWR